ncbi:MAG: diacylglycerol kinase family protein [Nitrospirota bacterium]
MDVTLIINPIAGNKAFRSVGEIEDLLKEKADLTTFVTRKRGDALSYAKELSGADLVIVAGGDGTINEVINGMLTADSTGQDRIPLGIIPVGTANVLAKETGIPENIEDSVKLALSGTPRKLSVGKINGRYFMLMAGIGFDGETVFGVNGGLKKISGKFAYVVSGVKTLIRFNLPLIKIKTSSGEMQGYTAVVSNVRCYGGHQYVTPEASITEPVLDICIFKGKTRMGFLRFVIDVLRGKHLHLPEVEYGKFEEFDITSDRTVHVQIDGDYFGTLPVKIEVVRDAVSLIC